MARFVTLKRRRLLAAAVAILGAGAGFSAPSYAQQMMAPAAPTPTPAPVKSAVAAPAKPPATNAAPMLPPDTYAKYGKIVVPGDQPAHPFKLKLPLPDVGEVKIPSADELTMRDKLENLAKLSDVEIRAQLEKWPAYSKMSLRDQGAMLIRIQDFRDYRSNVARQKAHDLGLVTLTPAQQAKFETEYWNKRLQLDHDMAKQFTPIFTVAEQKMRDDLYREYSVVSQGPIVQAPKPPAPSVAPGAKPTPPAPTSPPKPVATMTPTNGAPAPPVAQAPPPQ
jgi:hypothetical protein